MKTASPPALAAPPINLDQIASLYERFANDLARVRRYQRLLYEDRFDYQKLCQRAAHLFLIGNEMQVPIEVQNFAAAQLNDLNCELLYLLVRDSEPECVAEISPCGGWSTSWILNALHDNGHGKLLSFDTVDYSTKKLPTDLTQGIRTFHQGDVQQSTHLPDQIDFLLMDSDHTAPFAEWYIREVFPRVRSGSHVMVDDVFHKQGPAESGGEGPVVLSWLEERGIEHFQASTNHAPKNHAAVQRTRELLGLHETIVRDAAIDPAIYFVMP